MEKLLPTCSWVAELRFFIRPFAVNSNLVDELPPLSRKLSTVVIAG
jgi:hypothetical protein